MARRDDDNEQAFDDTEQAPDYTGHTIDEKIHALEKKEASHNAKFAVRQPLSRWI